MTMHDLPQQEAEKRAKIMEANCKRDQMLGDIKGDMVIIVLDLETTSLITSSDPHPGIVEIGAQCISEAGHTFNTIVDPEKVITQSSWDIHKIDQETAALYPSFDVVGRQFIEWIQSFCGEDDGLLLLAHNGDKFDFKILEDNFTRYNIPIPNNWFPRDTLPVIKTIHPKLPSYALENLYRTAFGEDIPDSHSAEGDVEALVKCLFHYLGVGNEEEMLTNLINLLFVY